MLEKSGGQKVRSGGGLQFTEAGWEERMEFRLITDEQHQGNDNNENEKTHIQAV